MNFPWSNSFIWINWESLRVILPSATFIPELAGLLTETSQNQISQPHPRGHKLQMPHIRISSPASRFWDYEMKSFPDLRLWANAHSMFWIKKKRGCAGQFWIQIIGSKLNPLNCILLSKSSGPPIIMTNLTYIQKPIYFIFELMISYFTNQQFYITAIYKSA